MTDFYTVLQNALSRVGAADGQQRARVYEHVRVVMDKQLRNCDPPLSAAEIDRRLSAFEDAIERIESDYDAAAPADDEAAFVEGEYAEYQEVEADPPETQEYAPVRRPAAEDVEPEWEEDGADMPAPAPEASSAQPAWAAPPNDTGWGASRSQPRGLDERGKPDLNGRGADPAAIAGQGAEAPRVNGRDRPTRWGPPIRDAGRVDSGPPPLGRIGEAAPSPRPAPGEPAGWAERLRQSRSQADSQRDDVGAAPDLGHDRHGGNGADRAARRGETQVSSADDPIDAMARGLKRGQSRGARAEPTMGEPALAGDLPPYAAEGATPYADDPIEPAAGRRSRRERARAVAEPRQGAPRRRIWPVIILVLAVVVVGYAATVFIPILFPSGPSTGETTETAAAPAAAPAAVAETPVPAAGAALPPAPAGQTPVTSPIILFQGEDPAVFEAGTDNPVRYETGADGGLVRISSSIASGGARAVIGPGVANALAGHSVRIVLEARGAPGQAAATVNLGYQHGAVELTTRQAIVPGDFGPVAATWAIPAGTGTGADYLLIDPGVPGDGTAIDIRLIRIEIVN
jgi:hypothetical protein